VAVSRRGFLAAAAAAPIGAVLRPFPVATAAAGRGVVCALDESRAGFARHLGMPDLLSGPGLLVLPGAVGWDESLPMRVREGAVVVFESAAGFGGASAFALQREGLRSAFGLAIEPPGEPWGTLPRPAYVDLVWPVAARVRDFSSVVVVRGGETVGRLGSVPVAARRRRGRGTFVFLGSPVGPALWAGDPQAHAWLAAVIAATPAA
jgi:hypothetical protein